MNQAEYLDIPIIHRRFERVRKSAIPNIYETVFATEDEFDLSEENDPLNFTQAIEFTQKENWYEAMLAELKSMDDNGVWNLIEKPEGSKPIGCKWVFKTKRDSQGKIERYKARLVAKGFTQKEGIDYTETFSPVSTKDALRIMMALIGCSLQSGTSSNGCQNNVFEWRFK